MCIRFESFRKEDVFAYSLKCEFFVLGGVNIVGRKEHKNLTVEMRRDRRFFWSQVQVSIPSLQFERLMRSAIKDTSQQLKNNTNFCLSCCPCGHYGCGRKPLENFNHFL